MSFSSFRVRLAAIAATGLGIRVWAMHVHYRQLPLGFSDNKFYSVQANALADGLGYLDPFLYEVTGEVEASASHPPLYSTYLAVWSWFGFDTPTWHRIASCALGLATVALIGLVARRIAGDAAGLAAAVIAAVYPPLWIVDGTIVAESLYAPLIAGVALAALAFVEAPDARRAAVLGGTIALAALTRSEGVALLGLLVVPLAVVLDVPWRRRATLAGISSVVALCLIAPWTIRNLQTFEEPVPLAYGAGYVMKIGNCDQTYSGPHFGYWHIECGYRGSMEPDMSVGEVRAREEALDYITDNLERVPAVAAARLGRIWHLYRVKQGVDFDVLFERRGRFPSEAGLRGFYVTAALAVVGGLALRRRPAPLVILGSLVVSASLSAVLAFGITRYRIAGDVALAVLAGIGVAAATRWLRSRRSARPVGGTPGEEPDDDDSSLLASAP